MLPFNKDSKTSQLDKVICRIGNPSRRDNNARQMLGKNSFMNALVYEQFYIYGMGLTNCHSQAAYISCTIIIVHYHRITVNSFRRPTGRKNSLSLPPEGRSVDICKEFEQQDMKYDSTGMFHWCPARTLEECVLVNQFNIFQF